MTRLMTSRMTRLMTSRMTRLMTSRIRMTRLMTSRMTRLMSTRIPRFRVNCLASPLPQGHSHQFPCHPDANEDLPGPVGAPLANVFSCSNKYSRQNATIIPLLPASAIKALAVAALPGHHARRASLPGSARVCRGRPGIVVARYLYRSATPSASPVSICIIRGSPAALPGRLTKLLQL